MLYGDIEKIIFWNNMVKSMEINELINKLLIECSLGKSLSNPVRVTGGLLNRMYKVECASGTYAIKMLNPEVMKRSTAMNNHIVAEKVANIAKQNGVKCLPAKIINNKTIQECEGIYFLIFDWFDGKPISDEEVSIDKCKSIAKELAKIHSISFDEVKQDCRAYYNLELVNWNLYVDKIENEELKELLKSNIKLFETLDRKAIDSINLIQDNLVISHKDLDLPNILWNEDDFILIDWESTGMVNPIMELIDTAWNWSGGQKYFDIEKFRSFVEEYQKYIGELKDFNIAIDADFKAKFGWLEYNLKRVCGIECIDEEEKLLGEKEVVRSIDEINKFYEYSKQMKI